ncbi:MAG: glycosyltransferase family 39 protein [Candidatus Zixiibacteriota bacterium]
MKRAGNTAITSADSKSTPPIVLLLLTAAVVYLVLLFIIFITRASYPFELEWMEGGAVDHVARVLHGQTIYVPPTIEFVPYIYTPLYYYVSALVALITGIGFLPLRLVSVLSTLGVLVVLYQFARRETGNWRYGLIAAGLYAAAFKLCGAWFDIGRADSLFVFLLILGVYKLRYSQVSRDFILAAVLLWLAFLAKQTAAMATAPLLLAALYQHRNRALPFVLSYVILIAASVIFLDIVHDSWFSYYIFKLPAMHKNDSGQYLGFWVHDIARGLPAIFLLSVLTIATAWRTNRRTGSVFYASLLLGCLATSWSSRFHAGGYDNALMPLCAILTLPAVLALKELPRGPQKTSKGIVANVLLPLVLLAQFGLFWYNPVSQIPTSVVESSGATITQTISKMPGELYMPYHGFLPTLAGKSSYAQQMAFKYLVQADTILGKELTASLDSAYTSQRFALVILDSPSPDPAMNQAYIEYRNMPDAVMTFWPLTGMPTRPRFWYVPRPR